VAYRFKPGESVARAVNRIAIDQIESAASQLSGKNRRNRDKRIHEARKSIKKVRALLRLIGPKHEDRDLREVAQKLAKLRDTATVIVTLDSLSAKYPHRLGKTTVQSVRRALTARKREAGKESDRVLHKLAAALHDARKKVKEWPLQGDGFEAIEDGLEKTYRRGRMALALARKHPTAENYHNWRKRVKDHWYHVRLLDVAEAQQASLRDLETYLGDDHNLFVLQETIVADPDFYGSAKGTVRVLELIPKYQAELRKKALSLGERSYKETPAQFVKRMKQFWNSQHVVHAPVIPS
jgi:hypothetical protein